MDKQSNLSTIHFGCCFTSVEVYVKLAKEDGFRLPTIAESIYIDFDGDAIWVSDMINNKHMVMDNHWGPQIVRGGKYGLVLVEKEDER